LPGKNPAGNVLWTIFLLLTAYCFPDAIGRGKSCFLLSPFFMAASGFSSYLAFGTFIYAASLFVNECFIKSGQ
jgi:hypothetical protein